MTTHSVPFSSDGRDPTMDVDVEDTSSIATPTIGYRNSPEDHSSVSKTIRFYFAPYDRSDINRIHPTEVHSQWIRLIQTAFGDDIKIINNANRPVTNLDTSKNATRAFSYAQQFKEHVKPLGTSQTTGAPKFATVIVHRIITRVPLGQLKRHPTAYQLLIDNHCYLNEHHWDEHEWDLQQIGFVTGYNPKYYTNDRVTNMFRNRLTKAQPRVKVPKFTMVLKSHRITYNGRKSNTQAYTIEVPSHTAKQLIPIIKESTKDTKEFVTFQMRRRNPEAFQGAIRYQNHLLSIQHVIVINNIGKEAMYYLSDRIRAISGVIDVVMSKKVDTTGRYYVLANKDNISQVRDKLTKKFERWYQEVVPEDARPRPDQFEGPPEIGNPRSDVFSEGDNSFMTNSTKSFMSFSVSSMPQDENAPNAPDLDFVRGTKVSAPEPKRPAPVSHNHLRTHASYAAATVSDQVSGITDSEPSPRDAKHEELSMKIASLESMVAALIQQVQLLATASTVQGNIPIQHAPRDPYYPQGKRQDVKDTPRKHKRSHDHNADSVAKESSNESAPMEEHPLTVWDDYSKDTSHE